MFNSKFSRWIARDAATVLLSALVLLGAAPRVAGQAAAPPTPSTSRPASIPDREFGERLLLKLEGMIVEVERIMGLPALEPIRRSLITRDQINDLVSTRLGEETAAEQINEEQLFLELFGFVREDFDLAKQVIDTLTEQATALYDYKTKTLYLSTWTPRDMQEFALVHELAHAIADQHFALEKYLDKSRSADGDLARSAVIEGQASWVMTEWVMQQTGRTLMHNAAMAAAAAGASRHEVQNYPVFSSQPLYLRETMLFPYTDGMIFQQAVLDRWGQDGFRQVFRDPPASTQQILDTDAYINDRPPSKPKLPKLRLPGFRRAARGDIGQLDHFLLLKQYLGEKTADRIAPRWRGGRYEIWQNQTRSRAVLRYASEWSDPPAAKRFFDAYRRVLEKKWDQFDVTAKSKSSIDGVSDKGLFQVRLNGSSVTSIEGLPPLAVESK